MKLGIMIYSLGRALAQGDLDVPGALALMKELDAEGVDMSESYVADHPVEEVRTMVADAGLEVSSWIGGASLTMPDPDARSEALDTIRRVIDNAAAVGTSCALVTTGACAPDQDRAEGRRLVAEGLGEVLPHAKQAGITVTIEDFGSPYAPYQLGAEVLECCELAGPELMITYDSGNMILGDEDPVVGLEAMRPRVVHAHAKDWELMPPDSEARLTSRGGKKYQGAVTGRGVIDYPAVFAALRAMHYEGYVAFEYEGPDDQIEAAREGMAYLREQMAASGA
jgi:sugar phosphate isomerase/epimerase